MKFLYVSNVSKAKQYAGILKKVAGQTEGVAQLGWEAHYTCVDGSSVLLCSADGSKLQRKDFPSGLRWHEQQQSIARCISEFAADGRYDAVYIKGFLANPYALQTAASAKNVNPACRVIFEIATYPYWGEYKRFLHVDLQKKDRRSMAGHLLEIWQHATTVPHMKQYVDALAVFGAPISRLWGIPAITIDNGVAVGKIAPKQVSSSDGTIRLLGVAGTSVAHGYSRVLEGLAQYKKEKAPQDPEVCFEIVGANETIEAMKARAESLSLGSSSAFLGYKNAKELSVLYNQCDAAVSSLGVYQIGLTWLSPLKSREYCAAGIPFLYAYEDTLPKDVAFAMKIPNDSSPVNIAAVVRFVERCRQNPDISRQERQYAADHFDWKIIMEKVLRFAGAADKS
ncbi:glycosyltransferase [Caproicibacterium sp. XB2]|jgi:glycosyltransferase involved in cell wall biosynthesis|uniref:glycosyltransferase n=1 Tax=Caproicibacterium TaxID=2834348 RepID=UPI000A296430|nr:hypothetical protein B6259_09775 [Ruminococcaceae bacterium CPB6]